MGVDKFVLPMKLIFIFPFFVAGDEEIECYECRYEVYDGVPQGDQDCAVLTAESKDRLARKRTRFGTNQELGTSYRLDCGTMRLEGTQSIHDEDGEKTISYSFVDRFFFRSWKDTAAWEYTGVLQNITFSEDSYSCGSDKNGGCNKPVERSVRMEQSESCYECDEIQIFDASSKRWMQAEGVSSCKTLDQTTELRNSTCDSHTCITLHEQYGMSSEQPIQDGTWRFCLKDKDHQVVPNYEAAQIGESSLVEVCQDALCNDKDIEHDASSNPVLNVNRCLIFTLFLMVTLL